MVPPSLLQSQLVHASALFLAAFLLFAVQPILGKALLPWFGGTSSVWTLCLLFFQSLLLAGYAYAHTTRKIPHLLLLAASLATLPVGLHLHDSADPAISILLTLALSAGLPCFVVSSTSPLLQRWSSLDNPYRLYALSNAASLIALISYPILIEPFLPLAMQFQAWSVLYAIFAILCGIAVWNSRQISDPPPAPTTPWQSWLLWILLAACGSGLLMATTNQMCQEVASIPFLWIVPLVIYLITFILTFERPGLYDRRTFGLLASIAIPAACALSVAGTNVNVLLHLLIDSVALFICLMLLHGELAATKPEPAALTRFYLAMALGGAVGGAFVALVAPRIFTSFLEFPILLALTAVLSLVQRFRAGEFQKYGSADMLTRASAFGLLVAILVPFAVYDTRPGILVRARNFYGVLRVTEYGGTFKRRVMTHGQTTHGLQFIDARLRDQPTSYYSRTTGVGMGLRTVQDNAPGGARIGLVGMGTGTLAVYGRPGDTFRFYEINPQVTQLARQYFTYLSDSKAKVEVVEGDARLKLAAEASQNYDAIIVDAFSSDSIPMHLLTAECGQIYKRHLKSGGRIFIHISNRTLNLEPVVRGLARYLGMSAVRLDNNADPAIGMYAATWMELSYRDRPTDELARMLLWRDEFASLWPLLF